VAAVAVAVGGHKQVNFCCQSFNNPIFNISQLHFDIELGDVEDGVVETLKTASYLFLNAGALLPPPPQCSAVQDRRTLIIFGIIEFQKLCLSQLTYL